MIRRYVADKHGSVAIEFAFLALPFFLLVLALIETGYKSLVQSELDRTLSDVIGDMSLKGYTFESPTTFVKGEICTRFPSTLLNCASIQAGAGVARGSLSEFKERPVIGGWHVGCGGDAVVIELRYPLTNIIIPFAIADVISADGKQWYRSRGVFRREPIISGAGAC
jgi:hypothetical protein